MDDEQQIEIDDDDGVLVEGGPLDEASPVANAVITQAEVPAITTEQDLDALYGEDEDDEDLGDDLDLDAEAARLDHAFELEDPRVAKLEATVQTLAGAEIQREQKRVRRKVTAATGGAGAVGFIPILLQLTGALDVDPELASAIVAVAAALGALVAGWATPERRSAIVAEILKPE